jgi:DNA-binding response OmpR family regulator
METATILIAEDEEAIAELIREILTKFGYGVIGIVTRGEEAVDVALETKPDLVLMDIELKGSFDGIRAFREIRKVSGIPIVFVSAYRDKELIARSMGCEPNGYIVKPFGVDVLLCIVRSVLDWHTISKEAW